MGTKTLIERASWTLVDQGVVSAGNFILNILLARTLSEHDYGAFAIFLGVIFVLRTLDYSIVTYPLSLRLHAASHEERAGLLGNTILLSTVMSLILVTVLVLGTVLLKVKSLMLPICLCYVCWQAHETARRCLLADFRYSGAVAGDGISYLGQALLIALMASLWHVTLVSALYAMSATFALGAMVHWSKQRFGWPDLAETRHLVREYVAVGKWSLISYQIALVRHQLMPWVLASVAGTGATASYQAAANIANTIAPINLGIGNAVPQIAAQAYRAGGLIGASRAVCGYVLFGLGPVLLICAAAVLVPTLLLLTAYGPQSPYLAVATGLQLLAIAGVFDYVGEMINKTLLGIEAGRIASLINVVSFGAAIILAFTLIRPFGVVGACLALLFSNLTRAIAGAIAIAWLISREKALAPVRGRLV